MNAPRPILDGLKVVELSAFVAAPLGGATLAELGAEVVRVDPPGGGIDARRWPLHRGRSLYWAGLNQGKRSIAIDTRTEAGQALVTDLVAHAGILLTNLPVRAWSSYERLSARRADLIMTVITGNPDGSTAVDYTVNAAVGFPWVTGPEDARGPVNHVLPAWDALTGYLVATAIVAAELHRVRTGEGQLVTLSLMDVALSIAGHLGFIGEAQLDAEPRARYGNDLFGTFAHDFATADGRYVIVVALTPRQWKSLVDATDTRDAVGALETRLGLDLEREGDRFRARNEIRALLAPWIAARPLHEVASVFERHDVLWDRYQTFKELVTGDERCSPRNPLLADVDQPGIGRYLRATSPIRLGRSARLPPAPSPLLGQDTPDILGSWLGLSGDRIAALGREGVIGRAVDPSRQ
jgi:2-methylfumaryl-CoA isomerase